ncbi:DUF6869 domain-containing protein (plasmid) [Novosphingobium sp. BL-8A]|uniref:DUF6869 domain-containing protein n=1 Tax=Novosphingobium sp. BL-8A TaxID=3127639 RepID=UPI00375731D0
MDPKKLASDWITFLPHMPDVSDDVRDRAWAIYDLTEDDPAVAWDAIKHVVARYTLQELLAAEKNEAQRIVECTASGPIEKLLIAHGPRFIGAMETEARRDLRMAWALGGVWRNSINEEVWLRGRRAAGANQR